MGGWGCRQNEPQIYWPKFRPFSAQDGPKSASEAPKTAQDSPKSAQDTSKTASERSKRARRRPMSAQRGTKTVPRWSMAQATLAQAVQAQDPVSALAVLLQFTV